jgi:hypothetical protein
MSPKTNLLTAGLTALGLFGFVAPRVATPAEPPPSGQSPAKAPSPSPTVLLLSNGRVLTGPISEDVSHYISPWGSSGGGGPMPRWGGRKPLPPPDGTRNPRGL